MVGSSHHKVTAFVCAIKALKETEDYEECAVYQHGKLPSQIEQDFVTGEHGGTRFESQALAYPDEWLYKLFQCLLFSAVLVSVI